MIGSLLLAFGVGTVMALLGGGGSILTIPIFVYIMGFDPKASIAMSLGVVAVVSLAGVVSHWRAGRVDARIALLFGPVAMIGTYLGARLSIFLSGGVQLTLFALMMVAAASFMLRETLPTPGSPPEGSRPRIAWPLAGLAGVGVMTGLVGVGGGFLIVPALIFFASLPMKVAVGTALLIIVMNSVSGFVGYLGTPGLDLPFMATFAGAAIVGTLLGSRLTGAVPQKALRKMFAVFLIVMGILILYQNLR
ncbi:MAG: sulfite exporter TauE/SafE family protein [Longimicrobiales bacterium]|nr:sulfite exporter TauE/SafE family protein [Longimicrobiales bacterium]